MAEMTTPTCDFGWQAVDFDLVGIDNKHYCLRDARGRNGLLIMFICNHCPFVKAIIDRATKQAKELEKDGIGTIAIMPNDVIDYPEDSFENMKKFALFHNFSFPYVIDETQDIAKAYGAVCTPDFYGFDTDLRLRYRGRLDESRFETISEARPELFEAMREIAFTKVGPEIQFPSVGCSIKWRN
jgi:peroxiredoxin